jgi:predicted dehydrogenase
MEAERRSGRIVQVGMQRRSYDLYLEGRQIVAAGTLGEVRMIRSWWLNTDVAPANSAPLEGKLDWDSWQGPATRHAQDPARFRHWRLFRDYAGGIVADQGAHVFDGIHLLMSAGFPLAVTAAAGRPHKKGVETPESVTVTAEYPEDFVATFSVNYAAMRYATRNDQMNHLDGNVARMDIGRETLRVFRQGAEETPAIEKRSERGFGYATELHVRNFLECVRTRQRPSAPVEIGFQACLVALLANLSLERGRRIKWNHAARRVEG